MNSHDSGVAYALMEHTVRQTVQKRANQIADITDAIQHGFKAEPDLAPCHLPLLSDDALARIFTESEKWRDKSHERALEEIIREKQEESNTLNQYYVDLRVILGTADVPHYFNPKPGKPKHIQYTEQRARALVANSENSERNRKAAEDAEARVDLLERYVTACDEKRIPYNWNVFKLPTAALRHTVQAAEATERLTRCDTDPDRVNHFTERKLQETEQSLRWHAKRHEAVRQLIHRMNNNGEIRVAKASELMDTLLDRAQTGEQQTEGWILWEWQYKPRDLYDDDMVEIRTYDGGTNTLRAQVVEWSDVEKYRPVK